MRFTNLFTLLVASSALAYSIKRDEFDDEAQKLGQAFDAANLDQVSNGIQNGNLPTGGNLPTSNLPTSNLPTSNQAGVGQMPSISTNEECKTITETINSKCPVKKGDSDKEFCDAINKQECKAALESDLSKCPQLQAALGPIISIAKIGCTQDENGKFCPISVAAQKDKDLTDADIQNTCKSKACTDGAIQSFTDLKTNFRGLIDSTKLDSYIASLKEEKCTAAHSGATHIKVGGALLLTLALVLSYF